MKHNLKLTINRIFTGRLWQQFALMVITIGVLTGLLCFFFALFGEDARVVIHHFFDQGASWTNWEMQHGIKAWHPLLGFLGAVFFSGALVAILTNGIFDYREKIQAGEVEYHLKNPVVIIGFDDVVPGLVRQLVRSEKYADSLILIHSSNPLDKVKDVIHSKLTSREEKRVVYMHSLRPSKEELEKLHTADAKEVFVVGDRTLNDHDSENMHIMRILLKIHEKAGAELKPVLLWFEQETSYAALQLNDIKQSWNGRFDVRVYNFYKDCGTRLLTTSHYHRGGEKHIYPEMDHCGITASSDKHVHLVVVGMNRMGVALAKEAAHLLHFPNFDEKTLANQTIITFIDDNADREMSFFHGRHPGYFEIAGTHYSDATNGQAVQFDDNPHKGDFLDVRFRFIKGRIEDYSVREWLIQQAQDPKQYLNIAICINSPAKSLGAGLYLPEELYKEYGEDHYTNIFIRQEMSSAMVGSLRKAAMEGKNKRYARIYPFGMVDNSMDLECQNLTMAMAFNYIYDYYFAHNHQLPLSLPTRSELQKQWRSISVSNQWSNIYLSDSFEFKLRSIGYDIHSALPLSVSEDQIRTLAATEHNRWNMEKLLIGYRALHKDEWDDLAAGKTSKEVLKEEFFVHTNLVPNCQLSDDDRVLDENIITTLPMILKFSQQ